MGTLDHTTITEKLEKKFTREEKEELTQELVQKMTELGDKRDEQKEKVAHLNGQIKTLEKDIKRLARCVKTGSEIQSVEVEITKDYEKGEKRFMRLDTNEVYKTVPMDYSELTAGRQKPLPLDEPNGQEPEVDAGEDSGESEEETEGTDETTEEGGE